MTIGAFSLVIANVFATKTYSKFYTPATIYYYKSGYHVLSTACSATTILTTVGIGHTLYISSYSGIFYTIFYRSGLTTYYPVQINL
jgi:hypothetical protein